MTLPTLVSDRLILRAYRAEDRPAFAALNADPEGMRYFPAPLTRAESDALIERIHDHGARHGFSFWALERREVLDFDRRSRLCGGAAPAAHDCKSGHGSSNRTVPRPARSWSTLDHSALCDLARTAPHPCVRRRPVYRPSPSSPGSLAKTVRTSPSSSSRRATTSGVSSDGHRASTRPASTTSTRTRTSTTATSCCTTVT